jgi:hypothetical protein
MSFINYLKEVIIDNRDGLGAVPDGENVDYKGLKVFMKPSIFLKLASPLNKPISTDRIKKHITSGGSIGAPFLDLDIPDDWDTNTPAKVGGHEGRNRMLSIIDLEGDKPIEVHLFPRYYRNRNITPQWIDSWNKHLIKQDSNEVINGPLFSLTP